MSAKMRSQVLTALLLLSAVLGKVVPAQPQRLCEPSFSDSWLTTNEVLILEDCGFLNGSSIGTPKLVARAVNVVISSGIDSQAGSSSVKRLDLAFAKDRYTADGITLQNIALHQVSLGWQAPFQLGFFSARKLSIVDTTLDTDCATLFLYQDRFFPTVAQRGLSYLQVDAYSSSDGSVSIIRSNITCSLPVAAPSPVDGKLVMPVATSQDLLNGLAAINRYGLAQSCNTVELTHNVSLAGAHWPGMLNMAGPFTIRGINSTWTILDLGGAINKVYLATYLQLEDLHIMNANVARGANVAPGSNWATYAYKLWFFVFETPVPQFPGLMMQGRYNSTRGGLVVENSVIWVPQGELEYLAQWAPFLLTNAADLSEALQEAQTLIPAFAVNYKVSNKTHLHLTRMVGIGYNSSFLTFATVNYLQLMSPPFPITVTTMYSPTFNVFNLFNNITLIPVLDQTDMMSALDGLQASPSPFATALVLWRNVTLDPKTWPVNGYSIYTTQNLYLAEVTFGDPTEAPLPTWIDFQRVRNFINFTHPACAGEGGPVLYVHKLSLVNLPNAVVATNTSVGASAAMGLAVLGTSAQSMNVQAVPSAEGWGIDQVLPLVNLAANRRSLNIMLNLSTVVVPYDEYLGLSRYVAAVNATAVEPPSNLSWYCSADRLVIDKPLSSAPVSATKFNLLYMYGILGVNSTVTYRPPPGVAMQYVNVFGPPSAPVGGESGLQAWQIAVAVVGSVVGCVLGAAAGAWAVMHIRSRRQRSEALTDLHALSKAASTGDTDMQVHFNGSKQQPAGSLQGGTNNTKRSGSQGISVCAPLDLSGQATGQSGNRLSAGSSTVVGANSGPASASTPIDELHGMMQTLAHEINDQQLVILDVLGQGGFGTVYKGQWKGLQVAVKTITFQDRIYGGDKQQHRAVLEAAISSNLNHPNVVITYSYDIKPMRVQVGEPGGNGKGLTITTSAASNHSVTDWKLYIIQEYCDAGSLRTAILKRKFIDDRKHCPRLEMVLDTALDLASGMCHLHHRSVVHGDLNPNNVLLKRDNSKKYGAVCKIADFGLSVKMRADQSHISNMRRGTPFYTAPEVMTKGNLTKAADVFSFGVMLWEMYHSMMSYDIKQGVFVQRDIFPQFPHSHCPARLSKLATSCLAEDPLERPNMADVEVELAAMLKALRRGELKPAAQELEVPKSAAPIPSPSGPQVKDPTVQAHTALAAEDADLHFAVPVCGVGDEADIHSM